MYEQFDAYGNPMIAKRVTKSEIEEALSYLVRVPIMNIKFACLEEMPNAQRGIQHACPQSGVRVMPLATYAVRHVIVVYTFCGLCGKLTYYYDRDQASMNG